MWSYFFGAPKTETQTTAVVSNKLSKDWIQITRETNIPPTSFSESIDAIKYNKKNCLGNSSHEVFEGKHKLDNSTHFVKHNDNEAMIYCESFMGHLYEMLLLYGVGRSYPRYNENYQSIAASSRELSGFETFKDKPLTKEQLDDPVFRERFIRILNAFFIFREDDGHAGNITTNLKIFDADCALWGGTYHDEPLGTYLIKGGRPNVDGYIRDPAAAFNLIDKDGKREGEQDILTFPNLKHVNPWYFASRTNYASSYVTNNPWRAEDVELVQGLQSEEALEICFEQYLEMLLDICIRFPYLAALHIPGHLNVPDQEQTIVDMYCKLNTLIYEEFFEVLTHMPSFHHFLETKSTSILAKVLTNCFIRNDRLEKKKQSVHASFHEQMEKAKITPGSIIQRFNRIVETLNNKVSMTFTESVELKSIDTSQDDFLEEFSVIPSEETIIKSEALTKIDLISTEYAKELIMHTANLALEIQTLEEEAGIEEWELYAEPADKLQNGNRLR